MTEVATLNQASVKVGEVRGWRERRLKRTPHNVDEWKS